MPRREFSSKRTARNARTRFHLSRSLAYESLEPRHLLATIQLLAAGVTNEERIELQIENQTVRSFTNVGGDAYGGQFVTLQHTVPGTVTPDQIRVAFTNDLYDEASGIDRNFRLDAVVIDGQRFETEDSSVFSTGTWKPEDGIVPGFRESEFLHSDGYFQFAIPSAATSVVEVRAFGSEGTEDFELRINNIRVASFSVSTNYQVYRYESNTPVSPQDVRIVFANDVFDESNGIDENLIVDYLAIDGVRFETEAPNVFSTGTWLPIDGIVPGFRQSEWIHTAGYFQFAASHRYGDISLAESVINVSESESAATISVRRTNGSDGRVTVDYRTVALSATEGEDFIARNGTLTFQDGETTKTVSIPIINDSDIEFDEQFGFTIDNVTGGAALLAPRTATVTIDDNDSVQSAGDGLLGEYFDGSNFTSRFLNRVDETINFNWTNGAPASGMGVDTYSVRWTGQIEPRFSELYTFETRSDDGVRLWVDDQLVIDKWLVHSATTHTGTISLEAGRLYDIRLEYFENAGSASVRLRWQSPSQVLEVIPRSQLYAADPPAPQPGSDMSKQDIATGLVKPTTIDWTPNGRNLLIGEQRGVIRVMRDGVLLSTPFLDFSDRVNGTRDRGLMDIAVHPDFESNPFVYLLYTYDPPEVNQYSSGSLAGPDGKGNRAGRLTRVTADAGTGYTTIVPNSEVVLVGGNSIWENFNAFANSTFDFDEPPAGILPDGTNLQDFIATDSESHTVGSVEFGLDGNLFVTIGDGTSYNRVDPRTVRVQDIDNLSGKVLRIDPISGEGLPSNPYFNGDVDANRSKVYQIGLRNPFRSAVHPTTGDLFIGDVGWTQWEEINRGEPGSNFGWPYYEGGDGVSLRTRRYEDLPEATAFYNSGVSVDASVYGLNHAQTGINAIILGDFYDGEAFPERYRGDLFFNDLGQGIVRNISFNEDGTISTVETFATGANIVVQIKQGPDGNLYYVDLNDGTVGRWVFVDANSSVAAVEAPDVPANSQWFQQDASGIVIAALDTGFTQSEQSVELWRNDGEIPNDGIDNDANGVVDDRNGYNFHLDQRWVTDVNGHGTLLGELMANNIASNAKLMPLRVTDADGFASASAIAKAIRYAVDHGADVIAIPLDTPSSEVIEDAIAYAAIRDVFIVAASGNAGLDSPSGIAQLSSKYANVLAAGAHDTAFNRLPESNSVGMSNAIQLDALGIAMERTSAGSTTYRGTSIATAVIAGTAAIAKHANPQLTGSQIRQLLIATARPAPSGSDSIGQLFPAHSYARALKTRDTTISLIDDAWHVHLGDSDNQVTWTSATNTLGVDGISYPIDTEQGHQISIHGAGGANSITVFGALDYSTTRSFGESLRIVQRDRIIDASRFQNQILHAGSTESTLTIVASEHSDSVQSAVGDWLAQESVDKATRAFGFKAIQVNTRDGNDTVSILGTSDSDSFVLSPRIARASSGDASVTFRGSEQFDVDLLAGDDQARVSASQADQLIEMEFDSMRIRNGSEEWLRLGNTEKTTVRANAGFDSVSILDSGVTDRLVIHPGSLLWKGDGFEHRATQLEEISAISNSGNDFLVINGSDLVDVANVSPREVNFASPGFLVTATGFYNTRLSGGTALDQIHFQGDTNDQFYFSNDAYARFSDTSFVVTAVGFETRTADGNGGNDRARILDSTGDDTLTVDATWLQLASDSRTDELRAFHRMIAESLLDDGIDVVEQLAASLAYELTLRGDWE